MILRRIFAATMPLAIVVGIVTACSSVPDVTFTTVAPDNDGGNVLPDGAPRPDGTLPDTTPPTDGPRDAVDPDCKPTGVENCEDGIDNDCDGNTDCADTECQPNYQCVDRAPAGFDLVAVSDARTTPCTNGYTDQVDLEMFAGANPSCACRCTNVGGSCTAGTVDITISTKSDCTTGTTTTRSVQRDQAACAAIPGGAVAVGANNERYEASSAATPPTSCDADATLTLPPQIAGRQCKPPELPNAGGCAPTQLCIRKPNTGFAICASRAVPDGGAPAACAAPYTNRRRAGPSVTASPDCDATGCSCNNVACTGTVTIFDTANCTGGKSEPIVAGLSGQTCTEMAVVGAAWTAIAYRTTAAGGCTPTGTATVTGSLDLTNETTICCKP